MYSGKAGVLQSPAREILGRGSSASWEEVEDDNLLAPTNTKNNVVSSGIFVCNM